MHGELAGVAGTVEDRGRHLALSAVGRSSAVAAAVDAAARSARRRGATGIAAELAESAANLTPPDEANVWAERMTRAGRWLLEAGDKERGTVRLDAVIDHAAGFTIVERRQWNRATAVRPIVRRRIRAR